MLHNQSISLKFKSRFVLSNETSSKHQVASTQASTLTVRLLHFFPTRSVCTHVDTRAVFTSTLVGDPDLKHWHGCTRSEHCFRHWRLPEGFLHWRRCLCCTGSDTCFGTDMDTCFDTDLIGTGMVALAFQNCFRHWRLPDGFLHWRRYLCCTRTNTDEGPMVGAVAFNTRLVTYKHSLRHRFRALAWQVGSALAFNTAFGTGVYHWRGYLHWRLPLEGVSALASILGAMHFLQHWSVGTDMDTCFDTELVGTGMVALAFQNCFRHWRLPEGFLHWRRCLCCTGSDTCFGTDMDTCFDTDWIGTGMVALAFQNCFRHWRLPEGFLHWRRCLCCTRTNTDEGPMEGAVAFNTRLGTYRHSLRHRFRLLARHSLALAFNTAFGTGIRKRKGN
ncbi:hypothetical protein INT47_002303 [Mucor saturninus]|uniref:Uncharacterized protein n=1 Tax=Mucor saturninus TaxID=64648 RepID=A0A8H7QX50_9FUNG|nr:hypothetical protein INT47_002303 [Mucor saturninus]